MKLEEIYKEAWSLRPGERPPTALIGTLKIGDEIYYFYGPDENGEYKYQSESSIRLVKEHEEEARRKKEQRRRRHFL